MIGDSDLIVTAQYPFQLNCSVEIPTKEQEIPYVWITLKVLKANMRLGRHVSGLAGHKALKDRGICARWYVLRKQRRGDHPSTTTLFPVGL